jgi:hypothetical protein
VPRPRIRHALTSLLALGLVLGACADDGELGGPRVGGALAASVGSFEYATDDLEDDVDTLAGNPEFVQTAIGLPEVGEPGRRPADLVAFMLLFKTRAERGRQVADDVEGAQPPTDAQIDQLIAQLDEQYRSPEGEALFQRFDDAFRRSFAEDFAYFAFLQQVDPATTDLPPVAVNPRYGTFQAGGDGLGEVVPPEGPAPAPFPAQ